MPCYACFLQHAEQDPCYISTGVSTHASLSCVTNTTSSVVVAATRSKRCEITAQINLTAVGTCTQRGILGELRVDISAYIEGDTGDVGSRSPGELRPVRREQYRRPTSVTQDADLSHCVLGTRSPQQGLMQQHPADGGLKSYTLLVLICC